MPTRFRPDGLNSTLTPIRRRRAHQSKRADGQKKILWQSLADT